MQLNTAITLDYGMDIWLRQFAWANRWRVSRTHDLDDLIQDGYLCFAKCRNAYPYVKERRHFMSLFQRSFRNHIIDLANKNRAVVNDHPTAKELRGEGNVVLLSDYISPYTSTEAQQDQLFGSVAPEADFVAFLKEAKGVVRSCLDLFTSDAGLAAMIASPQRYGEAENAYLCRLLGVDPQLDVVALVQSFLRGTGRYYLHHRSM